MARKAKFLAMIEEAVASRDRTEGCWEWPGSRRAAGYGQLSRNGSQALAHRVAFELAHGREPQVCRHKCDNPGCFNPDHLADGTYSDNRVDYGEQVTLNRLWRAFRGDEPPPVGMRMRAPRRPRPIPLGAELPRLLTLQHAAERAGIDVETIERCVKSGLLPKVQIGGKRGAIRVRTDDLDAVVEQWHRFSHGGGD